MVSAQDWRMTNSIEDRLLAIEDREAICRLMSDYAELCDSGYPVDEMMKLYDADGAAWVSNRLGEHYGMEAVAAYYATIGSVQVWARHYFLQPVIDITGDDATSRWSVYAVTTQVGRDGGENEPVLITATEHVSFRRTSAGWRFVRFDVDLHQISSLREGWVKEPFYAEPGSTGPSQG
jgi:hypothetical protein